MLEARNDKSKQKGHGVKCCTNVADTKKKLKARLTQISLKEADFPPDNQQVSTFVSCNHSFIQQLFPVSGVKSPGSITQFQDS